MMTSTRPVPEDFRPPQIEDVMARLARAESPEATTYDAFPVFCDDPLRASHVLLDAYLRATQRFDASKVRPADVPAGRAILETPAADWPQHLRAIVARVLFYWTWCVEPAESFGKTRMWRYGDDGRRATLRPLATALLRGPELSDTDLADLIDARALPGQAGGDIEGCFRADDLIYAAENLIARGGLTPTLRRALTALREERKRLTGWGSREEQARVRRIDDLLGETPPERKQILERGEPWAEAVLELLAKSMAGGKSPWEPLLKHCGDSESSKPSGKWLKEATKRIDAVGVAEFARCVGEWLALAAAPRSVNLREDQVAYQWEAQFDLYSDKNEPILKGLAWACGAAGDPTLAGPLGQLAEWCYKKIPNYGPRSPKVGNACLISLIGLPGQEPRAELSRLKAKVKQPTARKMIEKALAASAAAAGMTPDDLEELAVAAYGLTEIGRGERRIGGYTAEVRIAGTTKVDLRFTDAKGKSRASAPADLKGGHATALKELQQSVKELGKMLPALRDRLERLPMSRRELPLAAWRDRYVDHAVVGTLARRLIWRFDSGGKVTSGLPKDGKVLAADDSPLKLPEGTVVSLWHPVGSAATEVLAWREFLQRHEVTQPFKQAHREVYLLTDAERKTRTYSNRFAAHVLRQHAFAALCTQRGWKYRLMGSWDGGGDTTPTLLLPRWGLRAEYWLTGGEVEDQGMGSGVATYVSTDQVRFYADDSTRPLNLEKVPPLAFSEVMRDVDLFVGVASVGNDPQWQDAGADGRFRDYWHDYSFGDLSATADTRRAVLEKLLPRLKIAERAKLTQRFLIVEGKRRTYKIHLGSGNILMTPNDQYLCIVPDRSDRAGDVFLPFEGDATLALILSKAFLLAEDDKIADPTITRQIAGK
jgi:hypothetical protein